MSRASSPGSGKPNGLARVCRVWRAARSTVYRRRAPPREVPPRRPGPVGPMPDAGLVAAIRAVLAAGPFHAEGHRKVWARLRHAGVRRCFGAFGKGVARGLAVRHDHGPQYMADAFQKNLRFLGIEGSPAFVRAPEGNGCAERFICTLKENLLWLRTFDTVEELTAPGAARVPRGLQHHLAD